MHGRTACWPMLWSRWFDGLPLLKKHACRAPKIMAQGSQETWGLGRCSKACTVSVVYLRERDYHTDTGGSRLPNWGANPPLPLPPTFLPSPLSPTSLRSRPLKYSQGYGEGLYAPQRGLRFRIWCILAWKIWHLVAPSLLIFLRIKWPHCMHFFLIISNSKFMARLSDWMGAMAGLGGHGWIGPWIRHCIQSLIHTLSIPLTSIPLTLPAPVQTILQHIHTVRLQNPSSN